MDLSTTANVFTIISGVIAICGAVYAVFRRSFNRFVVNRFEPSRRARSAKQCPRCRALQPWLTARCGRCKWRFAGRGKMQRRHA